MFLYLFSYIFILLFLGSKIRLALVRNDSSAMKLQITRKRLIRVRDFQMHL